MKNYKQFITERTDHRGMDSKFSPKELSKDLPKNYQYSDEKPGKKHIRSILTVKEKNKKTPTDTDIEIGGTKNRGQYSKSFKHGHDKAKGMLNRIDSATSEIRARHKDKGYTHYVKLAIDADRKYKKAKRNLYYTKQKIKKRRRGDYDNFKTWSKKADKITRDTKDKEYNKKLIKAQLKADKKTVHPDRRWKQNERYSWKKDDLPPRPDEKGWNYERTVKRRLDRNKIRAMNKKHKYYHVGTPSKADKWAED